MIFSQQAIQKLRYWPSNNEKDKHQKVNQPLKGINNIKIRTSFLKKNLKKYYPLFATVVVRILRIDSLKFIYLMSVNN